jgi:tetratricopeptide (TPR) repeat protein
LYTTRDLAFSNLGEYRKAIDLYEKRIEIARRIGDIHGEGNALGNMGLACASLGDKTAGKQHLLAAKKIFQNLGLNHMVQQLDQMLKYVDTM